MKKIAIKVTDVDKSFKLPTERSAGLKMAILNRLKGVKGYTKLEALRDISFEVYEGDFLGIVGRNGSGKSTLLKLLAGIYSPDQGTIEINGKLVPFIELGVGFNGELTGKENVYLNGSLLGFSNAEMDAMYEDIVSFAELEPFMGQKLKNYSSGMQVRLAFSIAIRAKGDILVLDEVLAVGDEAFQRKCTQYFVQLKREKKTVILVTHAMEAVQQFCNKAMLISESGVRMIGNPAKVAQAYRKLNSSTVKGQEEKKKEKPGIDLAVSYKKMAGKLNFVAEFLPKINAKDVAVTLLIIKDTGEWVFRFATDEDMKSRINFAVGEKRVLDLSIENIFANGAYTVSVVATTRDRSLEYARFDDIISFEIVKTGNNVYWEPGYKAAIK